MGKNYGVILVKIGSDATPEGFKTSETLPTFGETDILKAFGIKNPVLNKTSKGQVPRCTAGEVVVGKMGDCWLIHVDELNEEAAISTEPSALEQQLCAAFTQGEILVYGNFETAMVYWYLLLKDGKRIRLKSNVREDNFDFGEPQPEEKSLYKAARMEEEGIEVYEWWSDKAAGTTTEYTATQVGGTLGEAIFNRMLGFDEVPENFAEIEYRAWLDTSHLDELRQQNWKSNAYSRFEQANYRWLPREDYERYFLQKIIPLLENAGFAYTLKTGLFTKKLPLCLLYVNFHDSHDGSEALRRILLGNSLASTEIAHWRGEQVQYELDHPMNCGSLHRLNLPNYDRRVQVKNAVQHPIAVEEICQLFEDFVREVLLPAVKWCEEPKNLLICLEEDFRLPFLSLQNLPELAVHLFRAEFQQTKKRLLDFDFNRAFSDFPFFRERFVWISEEEKREMERLPFLYNAIDFQRIICRDKASAMAELERFAAAYWTFYFPTTPPPVLDLPHRDLFIYPKNQPFNLSDQSPIVIDDKVQNVQSAMEAEAKRTGFFQRIVGWCCKIT